GAINKKTVRAETNERRMGRLRIVSTDTDDCATATRRHLIPADPGVAPAYPTNSTYPRPATGRPARVPDTSTAPSQYLGEVTSSWSASTGRTMMSRPNSGMTTRQRDG